MAHTSQDVKYIYVLLTRFSDRGSKAVRGITRGTYTHASIGIDDDYTKFYSIVTDGFRIEQFHRFSQQRRTKTPCGLYKVAVAEDVYDEVKLLLAKHMKKAEQYRYSKLGVALCLLHIRHKIKNHYFCSQFVAEILHKSEVISTKKASSLFLPDDFTKLRELNLCYQGNLDGLLCYA